MLKNRSFTLFELIITIVLVGIVYLVAINNFPQKGADKEENISLMNLKNKLLEYQFDETIEIKCIEDDFSCLVFIDGALQEDKLDPIFKERPEVYRFEKELNRVDFLDLELEQLQRYPIVFEYGCGKNKKCDEYIVETEDKVYIFNDFYKTPRTLEYISDLDEYFEKYINEVKDAF